MENLQKVSKRQEQGVAVPIPGKVRFGNRNRVPLKQELLSPEPTLAKTLKAVKALGDQVRIRLVLLLKDEEACVCELMEVFGMSQSRLSHHLILLREAGFLRDEKRGRWNYYRFDPRRADPLLMQTLTHHLHSLAFVERDRKALADTKARLRSGC